MRRIVSTSALQRARSITYKPRLRDLFFVLNEIHDYPKHYQKIGAEEATPDTVQSIIQECAKFVETALVPIYQEGDNGCVYKDGDVTTPKGWKEAYQAYCEAGWPSLAMAPEYGGQGMPSSLALVRQELCSAANWTWQMYPGLSMGCMETVLLHAPKPLKDIYLPKLASGYWTGVMDLTEAQAGTDLNQVKTKAVPAGDGTFKITGEKIFISCGEHDMADNIVHIVLARLPDAPPGTRGISLFLVPKWLVGPDGEPIKDKKNVFISGIEHKMGIKGSSTCVCVFDNSVGYLIGRENKGLFHMFTFMNLARIGTSMQAIGTCEMALQNSVPYARERMSMRALTGTKEPNKPGDRIIYHSDVRRMLLTQKAFAEGGRCLLYRLGKLQDMFFLAKSEKEASKIEDEMGLYTPILKGFLTECSQEAAYYGMQVYGGHGFIKEWGMEQIARDARISTQYEGTTGVQALDLIGRKVITTKPPMKLLTGYVKEILSFCAANVSDAKMAPFVIPLAKEAATWWIKTAIILVKAARGDKEIVGAASVDYLNYSGYIMLGHQWAVMAKAALKKVGSAQGDDKEFYTAKIQTAEFYFKYLFPRTRRYGKTMLNSSSVYQKMKEEWICPIE